MSDNVDLHVLGIDFNSAPPEIRARFHLTSSQIAEVYNLHVIPVPMMILSTCNRTECYMMGSETTEKSFAHLEKVFDESIERRYFYHYAGTEAWLHLLELAVGLKSMLIGETEILGQLQDAIQWSVNHGGMTREHQQVLGQIVAAARRIRHQTKIGGFSSSLYTLILRELKESQKNLDGLRVLTLGNGVIARNLVQALCHHGVSTTILARNGGKKHGKPQPVIPGVRIVFGYDHLPGLLREHQVIVTATAAPHYLVKAEHRELLQGKCLIDLSFPRNIDPLLGRNGGCQLLDLEYFACLSAANRLHKAQAVIDARNQCLASLNRIILKLYRKSKEPVRAGLTG
ncbi:MAG TPA: hypothetical protein PL004_08995 [Bacillota bacterium]|nr:hypothetical protein [Bacillota bacterium]